MKFHKFIYFLTLLTFTGFLLTSCNTKTSYINDQRGKSIPVTTSDSNTFTFKLSTVELEDTEIPEEVIPEETTPAVTVPEAKEAAFTEEEIVKEPQDTISTKEEVAKEPLATVGPKTGEP